MPRILNVKKHPDGVRIMIDDTTKGIDYPLPINPTPEIRYDEDLKRVEFELKGVDHVFNTDDDDITFDDVAFTGTPSEAAAKLRELFFLVDEGGTLPDDVEVVTVDATGNITSGGKITAASATINGLAEVNNLKVKNTNYPYIEFGGAFTTYIQNAINEAASGVGNFLSIQLPLARGFAVSQQGTTKFKLDTDGSFNLLGDIIHTIKPGSAGATDIGWQIKDLSNAILMRLVQHMATGDVLLETHGGAGTPEIKLDYAARKAIIRALQVDGAFEAIGIPSGVDYEWRIAEILGSTIKGGTAGGSFWRNAGTSLQLTDGQIIWAVSWLSKGITINNFKFWQQTQGDYVANNNNKIGIYTLDPATGLLTKVAQSANNGNLWKNASGTVTEPLEAPYAAAAGLYYTALLYNSDTEATKPTIGGQAAVGLSGSSMFDFPNNIKSFGVSNNTDLPATINMSSITQTTLRPAIYYAP